MRFAFTADIHLSRYAQDKLEDTTNLPERLHSIKDALYSMGEYCISNDIGIAVIGGDLLHGKSIIYALAQDIMLEYFSDFNDKLFFYVIDGNHDLSGKGANVVSALKTLNTRTNVQWIGTNHSTFQFENILFVPYSNEVVSLVKSNRADILISHFGLNEGMLNSGISIVADLKLKDLASRYKLVLLGHYHKPQEIIGDEFSLYYVGSPIQLDWGEKGDEKRFLVVNSDTLDVQSIPTTGYRKHVELEITTETKNEIIEVAKQAQKDGHHVKIIRRDNVNGLGDFRVIDKVEKDITDRGITSSMSQEEILKRYIEIKEIPEKDRSKYLNEGLSLIQECEVKE